MKTESEKKKRANSYYVFNVLMESSGWYDEDGDKVLRKIQISGQKSLYKFAEVITQSFGFYFDHCFGFYDNLKKYHDSKKAYELFVDIGEAPLQYLPCDDL